MIRGAGSVAEIFVFPNRYHGKPGDQDESGMNSDGPGMVFSCIACCIFHIISIPFNCSNTTLRVAKAMIGMKVTGGHSSNKGCFGITKKIIPGIWRVCRELGNLGNVSGNMRYFRDIEQRFDITCYQTIYIQ